MRGVRSQPGWGELRPATAPAPASQTVPAEVIDASQLEMLRRVSPDGSLLRKVVDAFLVEMPANLSALSDAVKLGDPPSVRQAAHRMRGAAANLGATAVAGLCAQLEQLALEGHLTAAPAILVGLGAELERAGVALRGAAELPAS